MEPGLLGHNSIMGCFNPKMLEQFPVIAAKHVRE